MSSHARAPITLLFALSLLWGSSWIGNELLRQQDAPLHLTLLRNLLACTCLTFVIGVLAAVAKLKRRAWPSLAVARNPAPATSNRVDSRALWPNLLLGVTLFALPDLLLVWASAHGAGAWTPEIYACMPLGLALAAGELSTPAILGPCAMLVLLNGSLPLATTSLVWVLPIAAAVALQGGSLCFVRRRLLSVASLSALLVQLATASAGLCLTLVLVGEPAGVSLRFWPASSITALCLMAALGTALAYPLFYRLLRTLTPTQASVSEWLQPLTAICESALLLHARPGLPMILAALTLVLCSASILGRSSAEPVPLLEPHRGP